LEKATAVLVAQGMSDQQIHEAICVDLPKIEELRASERVTDTVLRIQVALSMSPEQRIANSVNAAIDAKIRLLNETEDEKIKNAVSTDIMDRHFGKPAQTINTTSMSITANVSGSELDTRMSALMEKLKALEDKRKRIEESRAASTLVLASSPVGQPAS